MSVELEREKGTWLQVRMSEEEKLQLVALAAEYGLSISAMVRMMIGYFDEKHPVVNVQYRPKADAPAQELTGVM